MASNSGDSPSTFEEDDCSGDDEREFNGRRRRFCIERKQQLLSPSSKRTKPMDNGGSYGTDRVGTSRRRKICVENKPKAIPITVPSPPIQREQPKGPVIFINPKFVKKFIERSIALASLNSTMITRNPTIDNSNAATRTSSRSLTEEIDFKTSTRESLQAASTMAIIRLVAECIEDDHKRDDDLNKTLVARLIDGLIQHGDKEDSESIVERGLETSGRSASHHAKSQDPEEDEKETSLEGRPIPVIGGSVNHFSSNGKNNVSGPFYASSSNYRHNRRSRRAASEKGLTISDLHRKNLRNFS